MEKDKFFLTSWVHTYVPKYDIDFIFDQFVEKWSKIKFDRSEDQEQNVFTTDQDAIVRLLEATIRMIDQEKEKGVIMVDYDAYNAAPEPIETAWKHAGAIVREVHFILGTRYNPINPKDKDSDYTEYVFAVIKGTRIPEWKIEAIPVLSLHKDDKDGRTIIGLSRQGSLWDDKQPSLLDMAKEAAAEMTEPCVCKAHTSGVGIEPEEFRFAASEMKGMASRYLLFNAEEASEKEAKSVRVGIYNTGTGPLTKYWYKKSIKYQKGGVF